VDPNDFTEITYSVDAGVATITLNRPDRRNAWSGPMAIEYRWALHHAHCDPNARVVVLTGAGDSFCAGADTSALASIGASGGAYTKERSPLPPYPADTPVALCHNHTAPLTISTPVIAAINGACAGAGFVLATYADLRWASEEAKIATSFAALGLPAEYGIGWLLPRIVGTARALELLYDPAPRTAAEAARLGFVQRVLPAEALLPTVGEYARRLARHSSPASLAMMKRAVLIDAVGDVDAAYRRSVDDMDAALMTDDFRLGVEAARAKLAPDFLSSSSLSPPVAEPVV
jgi:enoyl-CoA hydratase/carnithine racemase